jgi:hypothetical protein
MKCKGKTKSQNCEPGLGQCKKGFLCRKEIIEKNEQQLVILFVKNLLMIMVIVILHILVIIFIYAHASHFDSYVN